MRKYAIILVVNLVVFATLFYLTNSLKLSLIAFGGIVLIVLLTAFELGLLKSKEEGEEERERIRENHKDALKKASKDNPTIR